MAVLGLRSPGVNPAVGVIEGLALVALYELATTLLQPYGTRGIVLTMFAAFVLAGVGLLATRTALHIAVDAAPDVGPVEHRLHGAVVAAIIVVVVLLAAGFTAAVVFSGPLTQPSSSRTGPGGGVVHFPCPMRSAAGRSISWYGSPSPWPPAGRSSNRHRPGSCSPTATTAR